MSAGKLLQGQDVAIIPMMVTEKVNEEMETTQDADRLRELLRGAEDQFHAVAAANDNLKGAQARLNAFYEEGRKAA